MLSAGEVKREIQELSIHTYPLCKYTNMPDDMKKKTIEIIQAAIEKHLDNYELAARMIKDKMESKFSPPFHVIVGEAYAFSITYHINSLLYMYTKGKVAILVWRTVALFK